MYCFELVFFVFLGKYPVVELLDHMLVLFFIVFRLLIFILEREKQKVEERDRRRENPKPDMGLIP